jgi:hypothetical protein
MNHFDALFIISELALGIAGFSGVVVALGARPGVWPRVDRLRLATLLASSLGALVVALITLMLLMLNASEALIWSISSLLVALLLFVLLFVFVRGAGSIPRHTTGMMSPYSIAVFIPTVVVAALTAVVQLSSAVGLISIDAFGVLFGGLVILLVISCTQFVRLLFMVRREGDEEIHRTIADS